MTSLLRYVRANAIAFLALFVALGGAGYAAISIPRNSVGAAQLRNHSIDPVKFDSKFIGGSVRAWAYVSATGKAYISHGFGAIGEHRASPGFYGLDLKVDKVSGCAATASVEFDDRVGDSGNGYAVASPPQGRPGSRVPGLSVATFDAAGNEIPRPFVVEVLC
jgi:hypothetical protein